MASMRDAASDPRLSKTKYSMLNELSRVTSTPERPAMYVLGSED